MSAHPTTAPNPPRRRFGRHAVTAAAVVGVALTAPAIGAAVALGTLTRPGAATDAGDSGTLLVTGQGPSTPFCQTPTVSVEHATPTNGLVSANVKAVAGTPDTFVPGNSLPDGTIAAPVSTDGRRDSSTLSQAFRLAPATFARNTVTAVPAALHAMNTSVTAAFH